MYIRITIILFFIINTITTQTFGQITNEEYLYTILGYKEQLQKGLDDKKGYEWKPLCEHRFVNNSGKLVWKKTQVSQFLFEGLYRIGEQTPCAIVAIYLEDKEMPKKDGVFISIPHENSSQSILQKASVRLEKEVDLSPGTLLHYARGLQKLAIKLAQNPPLE